MRTVWTESTVVSALTQVFVPPAHVILSQVRNGTGFSRKRERYADALVASVYPSRGLWLAGIEVKVSRSDWLRELKDPEKSADIQQYCKYWWIAAPSAVVAISELPETWGFIECSMRGEKRHVEILREAPALEHKQPDTSFVCSVLRAAVKAQNTMTPNDCIEQKVQERLSEAVKYENGRLVRECERLRKMVQAFEEASGVSLESEWQAGRIGDVVRRVLAGDEAARRQSGLLNGLRNIALRTVQDIDRLRGEEPNP